MFLIKKATYEAAYSGEKDRSEAAIKGVPKKYVNLEWNFKNDSPKLYLATMVAQTDMSSWTSAR